MIDTHVHVALPALPGSKPFPPELGDPERTAARVASEMAAAGVEQALALGSLVVTDDDPLGLAATRAVAARVPGLLLAGTADPRRTDEGHLERVEAELAGGRVKALKCYLGYLHIGPEEAPYRPYYELAARHGLPVVFHTGDTYAWGAKVKYAHPLRIDEVAVDHPEVRFVMAHFGCPWFVTGAEVVFKNDNVWADLSGLFVGDESYLREQRESGFLERFGLRLLEAIDYTGRYDRFLYGSDWPLAPMGAYRDFVRGFLPAEHHAAVFGANARALFGLRDGQSL